LYVIVTVDDDDDVVVVVVTFAVGVALPQVDEEFFLHKLQKEAETSANFSTK
jgi:hypothetical protein